MRGIGKLPQAHVVYFSINLFKTTVKMLDIKNPWLKRAGILLAIIPFIWIYTRLNFHAMVSILPHVAWWTTPGLLVIALSCMTLQGVRWWMLLTPFVPDLPLGRALSYHFIGAFYGAAIPSSVGQDVIKTLLVSGSDYKAASWAAFWLARILSLPAIGLLSLYGFIAMDKSRLPAGAQLIGILFYATVAVLFFLSFSKKITRPLRRVFSTFIPLKAMTVVGSLRECIYQYRNRKKAVFLSFLVTLAAQVLPILSAACAIKGITGHNCLWQCFAFIPLIELASASFPLTPNGMGVRETLAAGMFAFLHLSKEELGIYVMFSLFFSIVPRLAGFPFIFSGGGRKQSHGPGSPRPFEP